MFPFLKFERNVAVARGMIALSIAALCHVCALPVRAETRADSSRKAFTVCLGPSVEAYDFDEMTRLRTSLSESDWQDACRQGREAEIRRRSLVEALVSGKIASVAGLSGASQLVNFMSQTRDQELITLYRLAALGVATRASLSPVGQKAYAGGINPTAVALLRIAGSDAAVRFDREGRTFLRAHVAHHGWYKISAYGADADAAAWLIVQHADADRDFQKLMIDILEPLAMSGESSSLRFAHLYDRWAAGNEQPQRFGLQGRCEGDQWVPFTIANADAVDERRQKVGLKTPISEQIRQFSKNCH